MVKAQGVKLVSPTVLFEEVYAYNNASYLETADGIHLGNQSQFGAFSEIKLFYGFGSYAFGNNKTQGLGLAIYSLQEGPLISENRLKASFWKKIKLKRKLFTNCWWTSRTHQHLT